MKLNKMQNSEKDWITKYLSILVTTLVKQQVAKVKEMSNI